jgi:hypothetical protein
MPTNLTSWLAAELGGRITKTNLRTGPWLRRTSKIVARQGGLSWECYVNAASAWLWINGRVLGDEAGFSVNRKFPVMAFVEPLDAPFETLTLPVYVSPRVPKPLYDPAAARRACRRLEAFFEQLDLRRGDYFTASPDQITLWNRRPDAAVLQRRIRVLRVQFANA